MQHQKGYPYRAQVFESEPSALDMEDLNHNDGLVYIGNKKLNWTTAPMQLFTARKVQIPNNHTSPKPALQLLVPKSLVPNYCAGRKVRRTAMLALEHGPTPLPRRLLHQQKASSPPSGQLKYYEFIPA